MEDAGKSSVHARLDSYLKKIFYNLGHRIGETPGPFIIVPILVSLLFGTGLQRLTYENDPAYFFKPADGQAQRDQKIVEQLFPLNYSDRFDPSRFHRPGRFAILIVTAQDEGSLLRSKIWKEISKLDEIIQNVTILDGDHHHPIRFDALCAKWESTCYGNDILSLTHQMDEIEAGNLSLSYPFMDHYAFPLVFGGIEVMESKENGEQSTILTVKALQLHYFIDVNTPTEDKRGAVWEKAVVDKLAKIDATWKWIKVDRYVERTVGDEVDNNLLSVFPYAVPAGTLMVTFGVISCLMMDCVKSKPWLGIAAILSPTLGTMAGFGLVCYGGVPVLCHTIAAPFLMMGIGMDDAFVLLAAWRQTSVHDPVPQRLAEAYKACAVSVTLTSLTDMISFLIGYASPFQAIQIFSLFSATSILTTYLCHTFFFGAVLALSGYHEKENRHSLLFWRTAATTPKSKIGELGKEKVGQFWTGGIDPNDPHNPVDNPEHGVMKFFRDQWATFVILPGVKVAIILCLFIYLSISVWGISQTKEGMEVKRISSEGGYAQSYFEADQKFFKNFPYRLQIILSGSVDYSNETVQGQIEGLMGALEDTKFTRGGTPLGESWLRSFLALAENSKVNGLFDVHMETENDFIENLKNYYLGPNSVYDLDVKFDHSNGTKIVASRFIIQAVNVRTANEVWEMVQLLRDVAVAQAPAGLNVTIFHPVFLFTDQYPVIRSSTIQLVSMAALVMMIISWLLIPNLVCSMWVAFSVVSIETGVLGFLVLWGVSLDSVSLIFLVISVGFSVDFSAHIAYAYVFAEDAQTPEERLRSCLYSVGLPIVQGATSTILAVLVLVAAPSYDFQAFFKAIFIVMTIATAHGLLLLPVLLTTFGPGSCSSTSDELSLSISDKKKKKKRATDAINGKVEFVGDRFKSINYEE